MPELKRFEAYWTCCGQSDEQTPDEDAEEDEDAEYSYYFAPLSRQAPPYLTQRTVMATIDIAADGTLAGIELIDDMPPPPPKSPQSGSVPPPPTGSSKSQSGSPPESPHSSSHPGPARIEPASDKPKDSAPPTDDQ